MSANPRCSIASSANGLRLCMTSPASRATASPPRRNGRGVRSRSWTPAASACCAAKNPTMSSSKRPWSRSNWPSKPQAHHSRRQRAGRNCAARPRGRRAPAPERKNHSGRGQQGGHAPARRRGDEFSQLGFEKIFPVSAIHGEGIEDLMNAAVACCPKSQVNSDSARGCDRAIELLTASLSTVTCH